MSQKIKYLEGLRGIAALMVVIHHFTIGFLPALHYGNAAYSHLGNNETEQWIANSPLSVLYSGNFAVCIFFVLSGFVLTHKYFETANIQYTLRMMIKRYWRLILPVAASSAIIYFVLKAGNTIPWNKTCFTLSPWLCNLWPTDGDLTHFIKTTFLRVPLTGAEDYNTVLWTMKYEFLGSLGLGLLCLLMFPKPGILKWLFIPAIVVTILWGEVYYLGFIGGALLSFLFSCKNEFKTLSDFFLKNKKWLAPIVLVAVVVLASYPPVENRSDNIFRSNLSLPFFNDEQNMAFWHTLAAFIFIAALLCMEKWQFFFQRKFFLFLGRISFSMYLLHVLFIGLLTHVLAGIAFTEQGIVYFWAVLVCFVIYLTALIPFSIFCCKFLDEPAIRFSAWLADIFLPGNRKT